MTKRSLLILGLSTLLLVGCNTTTTSSDPAGDYNELQRMFETLQDNSFTATYEMNYASSTHSSTQTVMYTDYAIESSGYLGFHSVAQGDELIFPYTRDSEGTIISQAPVVNYYSGLRYMRIDEYQTTFNSIDIEDVVVTYEDGYYDYDFDSNTADNNAAMISLMALMSSGSLNPTSLRFQIVGNSLVAETVGIVYSEEARDTTTARFYNVGSTEISDIKEYLDEGGTAKEFVDDRFVAFMLPYFVSTNYSIDVDLTNLDGSMSSPEYTKKYTDDTEFNLVGDDEREGNGYVQYQGVVMQYTVDEEYNVDFTQAYAASSSDVATDLWGQRVGSSFLDVAPTNLTGYKDVVNGETRYHITDTQFITSITNLANCGYSDEYFLDEIVITIDDFDNHIFTVELNYYNRPSSIDLGTAYVTFYDLNNTVVRSVDRLLFTGENARSQDKAEFEEMMNLFRTNNYSEYLYGEGNYDMSRYVYNEDYMYMHFNASLIGGEGYIKTSSSTNNFTIESGDSGEEVTVEGSFNGQLPGTGMYFGANNDLAYLSSPVAYTSSSVDQEKTAQLREDLYNMDNYSVRQIGDLSVWVNTTDSVMNWAKTYFANITGTRYSPFAVGFQTSKKDSNEIYYDMNKVTFYLFVYDTTDGSELWTSFTYFNVGGSSIDVVEQYLESQQ